MHSPGNNISKDRAQDQQEKDRADEDQHYYQHTNHSLWNVHQRGGILCLPGKCGQQVEGHRQRSHSKDWQGKRGFFMLKNVWASKQISIKTKICIFNSNVMSVLYGCETWQTTKTMLLKIQTFFNICLMHIYTIRWPYKIRNEDLWERAGQEPMAKQILRRKWGWIRHPPETRSQHHMPSPNLKHPGQEEERQASRQLEARH
jgi:hypothetical protein